MKILVKSFLMVGLFITLFSNNHAQSQSISPQVRVGYYSDLEEYFIGAGLDISVLIFTVVPNFEYVFVDEGNFYSLNIDGQYDVFPLPTIAGYVGGGAGYVFVKPDGGDSESRFVLNIIGGVQAKRIPLKPFAQVKYAIISDIDNQLILTIGIHF